MERYGRSEDAGAYCVMSLESGPFFTMITLGVAGLSSFPWQTLAGAILPLFIGIALGNLDADLRDFLGKAAPALIPFFAFGLGAQLNLARIWEARPDRVRAGNRGHRSFGSMSHSCRPVDGRHGIAGMAAATTAGNAARSTGPWWPRQTINMRRQPARPPCWSPPASSSPHSSCLRLSPGGIAGHGPVKRLGLNSGVKIKIGFPSLQCQSCRRKRRRITSSPPSKHQANSSTQPACE